MANSFGTLQTNKVTLRMFDFLRFYFGDFFRSLSTDFSAERADFKQDVVSRIPKVPAVQEYSKANGYESTDAETTDIPVKLDKHKHVTLEVDIETQTETPRNLLDEQVAPSAYALGKDLVDAVLALVIPANFANELVATIGNTDVDTLANLRRDMNKAEVPPFARYALFNADAFANIGEDSRIVNAENFARNDQANRALGHLSQIRGFADVHEYPDLPETSNLSGFGATRDALVLSARLPRDPAELIPNLPIPGRVDVVQDPQTGIAMQRRWWYDMQKGKLYMSFVWMYGVSVGVNNNLIRVVTEGTGSPS